MLLVFGLRFSALDRTCLAYCRLWWIIINRPKRRNAPLMCILVFLNCTRGADAIHQVLTPNVNSRFIEHRSHISFWISSFTFNSDLLLIRLTLTRIETNLRCFVLHWDTLEVCVAALVTSMGLLFGIWPIRLTTNWPLSKFVEISVDFIL